MLSLINRIKHKFHRAFILFCQALKVLWQYKQIKNQTSPRFAVSWKDRWIHLRDATATTGFDRHYVFHTAWACRVIADLRPKEHVDIASSLYFVGAVSAFVPTRFLDFRPADLGLSDLGSEAGTLMHLPFPDDSIESLSCMHVVEHVGLGRYGDLLDYDGDIKAAHELSRVIEPCGTLLFVVPIGGQARIQFNAHRIYTYDQVLDLFPDFELIEFALIPDDGAKEGLIRHANPSLTIHQKYSCGCFRFRKKLTLKWLTFYLKFIRRSSLMSVANRAHLNRLPHLQIMREPPVTSQAGKRPMITFQAQGGLGNQLFQYAAARQLAIRHDCQLVVDNYWFDHPRPGETPRSLELNRYRVEMRLASPFELLCWAPLRSRWGRYLKPLMPMNLVCEKGCEVNREALLAPVNSYLSGFWQSEAYFIDVRAQLLQELTPIEPPGAEDLAMIDLIQRGEAISIHVRRGDYVSLASASAYHGLCTLNYYREAIAYVAERVSSPSLFVFSDDPDWCKANLFFRFPHTM